MNSKLMINLAPVDEYDSQRTHIETIIVVSIQAKDEQVVMGEVKRKVFMNAKVQRELQSLQWDNRSQIRSDTLILAVVGNCWLKGAILHITSNGLYNVVGRERGAEHASALSMCTLTLVV